MRALLFAGIGVAAIGLADDLKPLDTKFGLWETTTVIEMEGMPTMPAMPQIPKETLDKMPPAQRAQVESMMKNRAGAGGPRTTTAKSCTTKESIAKAFGPPENNAMDCKRQIVSSSSQKMQFHMDCTPKGGGPASASDFVMERVDSEHVKGNMVSKTTANDKAITMKMTMNSKWLSADCGDVKPYSAK